MPDKALLDRLAKLRDRKDWYVNENKRLRALCSEQRKHIAALEKKIERLEKGNE